MPQTIRAIYEKGVLRPLQPLDLAEQESVSVSIERDNGRCPPNSVEKVESEDDWLDKDAIAYSSLLADPSVSLAEVREALSGIQGPLTDAVSEQRGDY